jgi:hypothetical protein
MRGTQRSPEPQPRDRKLWSAAFPRPRDENDSVGTMDDSGSRRLEFNAGQRFGGVDRRLPERAIRKWRGQSLDEVGWGVVVGCRPLSASPRGRGKAALHGFPIRVNPRSFAVKDFFAFLAFFCGYSVSFFRIVMPSSRPYRLVRLRVRAPGRPCLGPAESLVNRRQPRAPAYPCTDNPLASFGCFRRTGFPRIHLSD